MSLLPAEIPAIPESRAGVVPARLARKVGPLFGVPWPDGPFGLLTWVSDYGRITLTEIARGAPLPTRAQAGDLRGPGEGWAVVQRRGITAPDAALPHEIANTTLNRFGPDTKAAVVLTAVNRLLDPVHDGVARAIALLVDDEGRPLSPALRLTGWAALVVEVFRSQPALVAAGIRGRAVQRQLCVAWDLPRAPATTAPVTRCEISTPEAGRPTSEPSELEVVDRTLPLLGLFPAAGSEDAGADRATTADVVAELLDRLLAVGTLRDASHLWLSERAPGALAVEALVPATSLVDRFVGRALRSAGIERNPAAPLPAVPSPAAFAGLPRNAQRATCIALLAVLRHVQAVPAVRERTRDHVTERLDRLAAALDGALPDDDPVGAVARCRIALMRVQTRRHDAAADLNDDVVRLLEAMDRCADLSAAGVLDRGAAAEIIAAAAIEANAVRWTNAARPGTALPDPELLDRRLRRSWTCYLDLLEVPAELRTGGATTSGLLGFHLHNYAAFLASHADRDDDLRTAVALYRDTVIPARERFAASTGGTEPLRNALQVGSRAATALARCEAAAGRPGPARRWAELGLGWIRRALDDDGARALLRDEPTEVACRLALQAAATLVTAAEQGITEAGEERTAAELLDVARRWEQRALRSPDRHVRHAEIDELAARLAALGGPRLSRGHPPAAAS